MLLVEVWLVMDKSALTTINYSLMVNSHQYAQISLDSTVSVIIKEMLKNP